MTKNDVTSEVRNFVVEKLFLGKAPADFTNDTALISTRLLDSIIVLSLVNHLEEKFSLEIEAHEVSVDNLDTINLTANFIFQKLAK